jgi:hypothetical protein
MCLSLRVCYEHEVVFQVQVLVQKTKTSLLHDVVSSRPSTNASEEDKAKATKHAVTLKQDTDRIMKCCLDAKSKPNLQRFKTLLMGYSTVTAVALTTVGTRSLSVMDALYLQRSQDEHACSEATGSSRMAKMQHAQHVSPVLPCKRKLPDLPADSGIRVYQSHSPMSEHRTAQYQVLLKCCLGLRCAVGTSAYSNINTSMSSPCKYTAHNKKGLGFAGRRGSDE